MQILSRSALGLVDVYNLLPAQVVGQKSVGLLAVFAKAGKKGGDLSGVWSKLKEQRAGGQRTAGHHACGAAGRQARAAGQKVEPRCARTPL